MTLGDNPTLVEPINGVDWKLVPPPQKKQSLLSQDSSQALCNSESAPAARRPGPGPGLVMSYVTCGQHGLFFWDALAHETKIMTCPSTL